MYVDKNYIIGVYRELHKVPEIGFDLPKSTAIICRELDAIGIPYTQEIGKSCIIATLNEGVGNKTIALRADFDALPIQEETGLACASQHPGKMHACGHDAHAAMLLGTIKALKAMEKEIKCCVKFIFQSAEEILGGAKSICETGFMDQVDEILGCHIRPGAPTGAILINRTCDSACSRGFNLHLYGKASHVATPQAGVDAIAMAVRVYNDVQFMRARELNPLEKIVIGVGTIHGGNVNNIVCDHVEMSFSIRTQSTPLSNHIYERIQQIANSVAADMGGRAEVEPLKFAPALHNDLTICDQVEAAAVAVIGSEKIGTKAESMGAEDFAYYLEKKPGCLFNLGITKPGTPYIPLHNEKLIIDEDALDVTPKVFIQYILDQMNK
ncbi:MAG: amidohydrolase [Oscillospiraceae bacterium]|nr:amidohydrolase [Oscillospiraceae bacterium]